MATDAQSLHFERSEGIPNNPQLPVVLRLGVQDIVSDPDACERLFARNGWVGSWRDGVFPFHHFHSNAHEVLGLVQGEVTIMLGGPGGQELRIAAGDVVVLPAGTGHKRQAASDDLLVIGAYPTGQEHYDLRRGDPEELEEAERNIAAVPLPATDPVDGAEGPLVESWALAG
jgi:uncharacterized protein YjlB